MRSVLFPLIMFVLIAGIAIAENPQRAHKHAEGFRKERVSKLRGGKYSRMFLSMVHKTKTLELNEEQTNEVNNIAKKYASSIIADENESRTLQRKFMTQLQSSDFDPDELKAIVRDNEKIYAKAADSFIDGLSELKKAIGFENFAMLTPISRIDRNALIKLRRENIKKYMEEQEAAKKESDAKPDKSE